MSFASDMPSACHARLVLIESTDSICQPLDLFSAPRKAGPRFGSWQVDAVQGCSVLLLRGRCMLLHCCMLTLLVLQMLVRHNMDGAILQHAIRQRPAVLVQFSAV